MRKLAALVIFFLSLGMLQGQAALAETGLMGAPQDDDFGIAEELKKESEEKIIRKEDLPPINMIYMKGGCFEMGDHTADGDEDERPVHEVCLGDYYIADTEVTQELFTAVMGGLPAMRYNPKMPRDPQHPVNYVSWSIVQHFIKKLNKITGGYYRLPTEAEWEYAAREGGKKIIWSGVDNEGELGDYAWFSDNVEDQVLKPVRGKKPNALGIYGMSGNAIEWVEDYFDFDYYQTSPKSNPYGPDYSLFRSVRGGSIFDPPNRLRTTYRYGLEHSRRFLYLGFRLAE